MGLLQGLVALKNPVDHYVIADLCSVEVLETKGVDHGRFFATSIPLGDEAIDSAFRLYALKARPTLLNEICSLIFLHRTEETKCMCYQI